MSTPPRVLGTYATPAFSYGDVVRCARRGEVRIVGLSFAPIPWPIGQRLPRGIGQRLPRGWATKEFGPGRPSASVSFASR